MSLTPDILFILTEIIEEYNLEAKVVIRFYTPHITFKTKKDHGKNDHYQLVIHNDSDVRISRVNLETKITDGRFHMVPENRTLLSVDLHEPNSLKIIREWLERL